MEQVLKKIDALRKKQGLSIYKLTTQAELSENTIYNWYKKASVPTIEALQAVCRVLDVPLFSLFVTNEAEVLTAQEETLLARFRALSPSQKDLLLRIAQEFSAR